MMSPYQRSLQKAIAKRCRELRINLGYAQKDVAAEIKASAQDICDFEHARNNSATIYQWYLWKGVKID